MSPRTLYLACALATWVALVADGVTARLTPARFVRALRYDIKTFGLGRVLLWALLCLFAWWLVVIAWAAEHWLDPRS